jgi:sugar phosphate isomerase/epimerase
MPLTRRAFLALSAVLPWALHAQASQQIPIGLELYSVRDALQQDLEGTLRSVGKIGYECVEFYAPYFEWSATRTKQIRQLLDDLGLRCYSTHNDESYFKADKILRARDMNLMLGCKYMVMSSSDPRPTVEGWKGVADELNSAADRLEQSILKVGYHNHEAEFTPVAGIKPIEIIAKNTKPSIMLQLDVGTCLKAGSDPTAWIRANPGRIRSLHLKDWSSDPAKDYKVLFGEGDSHWKQILDAAETIGGAEYLLIEQEGSRFSQMETARRCLRTYRAIAST